MSVRPIVFSNEPALHEPSRRVRVIDEEIEELIEDMIVTMREADGVGLAAIQVGVPTRVVVVEVPVVPEETEEENEEALETELYILINPEIVSASDEVEERVEGCLSIPGWAGEVERHRVVTVAGLDRRGEDVRIRAEGLLARVFQHEIDHCEGVLFIDRIADTEKIWRVEEGEEEGAQMDE